MLAPSCLKSHMYGHTFFVCFPYYGNQFPSLYGTQVWGLPYMVYGDTANTAPMKMLARWHLASCLTSAS